MCGWGPQQGTGPEQPHSPIQEGTPKCEGLVPAPCFLGGFTSLCRLLRDCA